MKKSSVLSFTIGSVALLAGALGMVALFSFKEPPAQASQDKQEKSILVEALAVQPEDDLMLISTGGKIVRIQSETIRQTGRATQGVRVINLAEGEVLAGVARIAEEEAEEGDSAAGEAPAGNEAGAE